MLEERYLNPRNMKFSILFQTFIFKRSKYSSAYRFGYFSKKKKKWGHYAQVHRIRIQNEILSVIIGE